MCPLVKKTSSMNFQTCLLLSVATLTFSMQQSYADSTSPTASTPSTALTRFDQRAKAGERLNVVFFGASLTWGSNASDPQRTSYRAAVARRFEAKYPKAHFRFIDAAIGGTGSQLGVFRLQRDVLNYHPDLVFLDFSANDDISTNDVETLSSYESLVRRVVGDAKCPLIQVIFPFRWNIGEGEMAKMKRRDAHLAISRAYGTPVGDAIALINERVQSGTAKLDVLWPLDPVHPGDEGYDVFASAAWDAYQGGVARKLVPHVPPKMLYNPTYLTWSRTRVSSLGTLPAGWRVGIPNRTSAYFDFLMSRWLDDEVIASNRRAVTEVGKTQSVPQTVERLKVRFRGTMVMLLGETSLQTGKYRAYLDGKLVQRTQDRKTLTEYDPGAFGKAINGNGHHVQVIATGLNPSVDHTLEIEPLFDESKEQELRIESICVAGGAATVFKP
ncbi:SGNH/GDSL hydrolase family protein [bacterium]|nr:MAG: SGNH/GDSL hydrolase family protein [bacterium]